MTLPPWWYGVEIHTFIYQGFSLSLGNNRHDPTEVTVLLKMV